MEENCEGKAREKNRTIRFWQNYIINKLKEKEKERKQKLRQTKDYLSAYVESQEYRKFKTLNLDVSERDRYNAIIIGIRDEVIMKFEELLKEVEAK